MQIEVSTDSNIEGREKSAAHVKGVVESALNRFSDRITRVEVHLSDVNSYKGGEDGIRCVMEARTIYFETVDWATSKPSISNSPWIRDAPQSGFSLLTRRIRSRRPRSRQNLRVRQRPNQIVASEHSDPYAQAVKRA